MTKAVSSSTFAVSHVEPATEALPELPYHEAVTSFLRTSVESCSRYHGRLVANVVSHPLIAALHGAFCSHRPLSLSPDIVWLTITQGLAIHINENAEQLRREFVAHDSQLKITVRRDDFVKGSPENPWPEVFSAFSAQVREHIGDAYDLIVADFSTTGTVERAASEVVLLDAMQSYFSFEMHTLCGIPAITLEGTVDDWESIASRVQEFARFGLSWWVDALRPILKRFVQAADGEVDQSFWESIYKYQGPRDSGSPHVSGWATTLFTYLCHFNGSYRRNHWVDDGPSHGGPSREAFPNTTAKAPFKWLYLGSEYDMEFIGGLIGVSQEPQTLTLRPEIGWAVLPAGQPVASGGDDLETSQFSVL